MPLMSETLTFPFAVSVVNSMQVLLLNRKTFNFFNLHFVNSSLKKYPTFPGLD